jgi:hypothetical protein
MPKVQLQLQRVTIATHTPHTAVRQDRNSQFESVSETHRLGRYRLVHAYERGLCSRVILSNGSLCLCR